MLAYCVINFCLLHRLINNNSNEIHIVTCIVLGPHVRVLNPMKLATSMHTLHEHQSCLLW
jgi:hypothetical protein